MQDKNIILLIRSYEDESDMGSLRWQRFRKYLSRAGWTIHWVCVRFPEANRSGWGLKRVFVTLGELRKTYKQAKALIVSQNISVVIATIPYVSPMILGVILKFKLKNKIKLIMELRDIYARNMLICSGGLAGVINQIKENLFIRNADVFWFLTPGIKEHYLKYYPGIDKIKRGDVVTNGFDIEEYPEVLESSGGKNKLEINYFGTFYGSRNPESLLEALNAMKDTPFIKDGKLKLNVYGRMLKYPLAERIKFFQLETIVEFHGLKSHDFILNKYNESDVLLIITHKAGSEYALPGKLFEYMGSTRPVWVITEDKLLVEAIEKYKLGFISGHETDLIRKTLEQIIHSYIQNKGNLKAIESPDEFNVCNISKKIDNLLETLLI